MASVQALSNSPVGPNNGALEETIRRISAKPGVTGTLVIEKSSGRLITESNTRTKIAHDAQSSDSEHETMASRVWKLMKAAGSFVQDADIEDEVKLLRLRTKKHEFVIVPDAKYILVAVHDVA